DEQVGERDPVGAQYQPEDVPASQFPAGPDRVPGCAFRSGHDRMIRRGLTGWGRATPFVRNRCLAQGLWMHALKWPGATSSSGGTTSAHSFVAIGQRVRKTQPDGGFMGLGMSPWRMMRSRLTVGSGMGTADSRASVYGWMGLA